LARLAGLPDGLVELCGVDPGVGVGDHGNVPVACNLGGHVHAGGPVEQALDVVALDHLVALERGPEVLLEPLPGPVPMSAVVAARNQYRNRALAELCVERKLVAVNVLPDGVGAVVGRGDASLVLVPAAELRVDHVHERVAGQPSLIHAPGEVLVEAAPLAEGAVEAADLIDDLAGEI